MEALFSRLSILANQALDNDELDPSKIEDLLQLFEQEARASWASAEVRHQQAARDAAAAMKDAEDSLSSLMDAAMNDFHRFHAEAERSATRDLSTLERSADDARKAGRSLGAAVNGAAKKYVDGATASAVSTMKAAFAATSKVHPS